MYILHYDIVAVILNIINIVTFYSRKNLHDKKSMVLCIMLFNSILATCSDFFSSVALIYPEEYSKSFTFFVTNVYYLLINCKSCLLLAYLFIINGKWRYLSKIKRIFIFVPFIFALTLIITNPITKLIFYIDENQVYHRGSCMLLLYVVTGFYMIYATVCTIKAKEILKYSIYGALFFFLFTYVVTTILQTLLPHHLITCLGISLCEMLILMTMQNSNEVIDQTTELYNRNAFFKETNYYIENKNPFLLVFIVIEDITHISYTLGYKKLNLIMKEIALFIKKEVDVDEQYYLGGKCFALILNKNIQKRKEDVNTKIHNRFKEVFKINEIDIHLSARVCYMAYPENITNGSEIFDYIDFLSHDDYRLTKDKVIGISEISLETRQREQEIRKVIAASIEPNRFQVYYQPIYSVKEKCFVSAEALTRLIDDKIGFIPPDEFIPIIEKDGSIIGIGLTIFEMVCAFIKEADLINKGIQFMEINLSVVQCMQADLKEQIINILKKYKLKPNQICLEITESVASNSPESMNKVIKELNQEDMTFALDDYGTGFSNMSYLLDLPFRYIKLDKSIVWAYFENEKGRIALESTITMMKQMNLEIIAEGVETKEQAEVLERLGVDYLQGYYYSKPVTKDEFISILRKNNRDDKVLT